MSKQIYVPGATNIAPTVRVVSTKASGWRFNAGEPGSGSGNGGYTNQTSQSCRVAFQVAYKCYAPQFIFDNVCRSSDTYGETYLPNTITVTNCYFYDGTTYSRCTFNNANSVTLAANVPSYALTDARNDLILLPGVTYYVSLYWTIPNGGVWPYSSSSMDLDAWYYGADISNGTGGAYENFGGYYMYYPIAILAKPVGAHTQSALLIGDSIGSGYSDDGTTLPAALGGGARTGQLGYIQVAFGATSNYASPYAVCKATFSGDTLSIFSNLANYPALGTQMGWYDWLISEIGINDLPTSNLATMQAQYQTLWAKAKACGPRVAQTKLTPHNSLTSGQLILRNQINAWFDTQVGSYIDAVIDPNPALETTPGSGQYISGLGDGGELHPTGAGCNAAATQVTGKVKGLLSSTSAPEYLILQLG